MDRAMKTCPRCAALVRDTAGVCALCGGDLTQDVAPPPPPSLKMPASSNAQPSLGATSSSKTHSFAASAFSGPVSFLAVVGVIAYMYLVWSGASGVSWPFSQSADPDQSRVTVAEKLARTDSGSSHPDAALVRQFDAHLSSLEWKCRQSRRSTPNLGDITVNTQRVLAGRGRGMSLLQV